MKAGTLKDSIYILKPFKTVNEYGETVVDYKAIGNCRAYVKEKSNQRTIETDEVFYNVLTEMQIRDYIKIDEWCRILFRGKVYKILTLLHDTLNRKITITAEKINE